MKRQTIVHQALDRKLMIDLKGTPRKLQEVSSCGP